MKHMEQYEDCTHQGRSQKFDKGGARQQKKFLAWRILF
jgi:hypothetical protein